MAPRRQPIHQQIAQRLHQQAPDNETLASDIAYHAALAETLEPQLRPRYSISVEAS